MTWFKYNQISTGAPLLAAQPENEFREKLATYIQLLINEDFSKLISILYRLDISEYKLKNMLRENPAENAGLLIADLIIEREGQKIASRKQFRQQNDNLAEEEKW